MIATALPSNPLTRPAPLPGEPARVRLAPAGPDRRRLDGAWWPRSGDLRAELPSLIEALEHFGRVTRVTVNHSTWPDVPHKLVYRGRMIHAGWFDAEQDAHLLCALDGRGGRWELLVIPPSHAPSEAARLMTEAARPANRRTATDLLDARPAAAAAAA